jgi:hypothetical protein
MASKADKGTRIERLENLDMSRRLQPGFGVGQSLTLGMAGRGDGSGFAAGDNARDRYSVAMLMSIKTVMEPVFLGPGRQWRQGGLNRGKAGGSAENRLRLATFCAT